MHIVLGHLQPHDIDNSSFVEHAFNPPPYIYTKLCRGSARDQDHDFNGKLGYI